MLEPDLVAFTFRGTCATAVEVVDATLTVVLNAIELEVSAAFAEDEAGTRHRGRRPSASTRSPSGSR